MDGRTFAGAAAMLACLIAACGGYEVAGGDPGSRGTMPVVRDLATPLGVQGIRGIGPLVGFTYKLRDREFDPAEIEVEFGIDRNGDGRISPEEYRPATPGEGGDGTTGLAASPGEGAGHLFYWHCAADLPGERRVTVDVVYGDTGRVVLDREGRPLAARAPGVVVRIRPVVHGKPGAYVYTDPFDVNNDHPPSVRVLSVRIPPEGKDDGTVNEQVFFDLLLRDPDGDPVTLAVDRARVPDDPESGGPSAEDPPVPEFRPAASGAAGEGTSGLAASPEGVQHRFAWDSIADVGTVRGSFLLRFKAVDGKNAPSGWTVLEEPVRLDNHTVFHDPGTRLGEAVAGARAVVLADGSVLVTGGTGANGPTAGAWLLFTGLSSTTRGEVVPAGSGMHVARTGHTATRLADGRVLLAGGFDDRGVARASAELYDPATRTFTLLEEGLVAARADHTAVLLLDGRILLAGGRADVALDSAELFDPDTGRFVAGPDLANGPRHGARGVLLPDGRVLLAGGEDDSGPLSTVELHDPVAGIFVPTDVGSDLPAPARGLALTPTLDPVFAAVATGGGAAGITGRIARFDFTRDRFAASGTEFSEPRADHSATLLGDGLLLIAGGRSDTGEAAASTAELYDVAGDRVIVPNGDPLEPVADASVVVLPSGHAVVLGGRVDGIPTDRVQVFTPEDGFNRPPEAQVRTPEAPVPWSFGARILWRAVDPERDPVRIRASYLVRAAESDDSGSLPASMLDRWLPATMKAKTVLGERSSGRSGLPSRAEPVDPEADPIDAPDEDEGEHLFLWDPAADLPRGDYENVFFRIEPFGATAGPPATTGRFPVTENAPVIARLGPPVNRSGNLAIPFWLQDSDVGDLAAVTFEYGVDENGDGRIVPADGESWSGLARSPVAVAAGDVLVTDSGTTDLVTGAADPDPDNDRTDVAGIPWGKRHWLVWDSVRDLGAPASPRSDLVIRASPRDHPPGRPEHATAGIPGTLAGFTIQADPDALALVSFEPAVAGASDAGGYGYAGVKLDEPIVFRFSDRVDPASLSRHSVRITRGTDGPRVAGHFSVDNSSGRGVVTFHPQVQELPARADVLEEETGYRIEVPGYDPSAPEADVVTRLGADPRDTNSRYVLLPFVRKKAFRTGRGVGPDTTTPSFTARARPESGTGAATDSPVVLVLDDRIQPASVAAGAVTVVARRFDGVESVVPGTIRLRNRVDESGTGGALREYAEVEFTPALPLPADGARIEVRLSDAITDLAGNRLSAAVTTSFTTAPAGKTVPGGLTEGFGNTTRRDAERTTAFWGTADPVGKGGAAGSGVDGKLTGGYDAGDGSDGTLDFSAGDVTLDTDEQAIWQLTDLDLPRGRTLLVKGSKALDLRVQGRVRILGRIDAAGRDGGNVRFHDVFQDASDRSGDGAAGGRGGPGGGAGGDCGKYTWKQSGSTRGSDGSPGVNAADDSAGGRGTGGVSNSSGSNGYGAGGGGAGHVEDGEDGGLGFHSRGHTKGGGGRKHGSGDFSDGLEGGSGGGAGGSVVLDRASGVYERWGHASGGGGGGGGGAIRITCGGRLELMGSGEILAGGGAGGNTIPAVIDSDIYYRSGSSGIAHYSMNPGGGGGGSGGSVWLRAGSGLLLLGAVDVRGGRGGIGYLQIRKSDDARLGDTRGGDGADGRIRLEGPTAPDLSKARKLAGCVRVVAADDIDGGQASVDWKIRSDTTVDTDTGRGAPNGVYGAGRFRVRTFSVASGATLTLTGGRPFLLAASGDVKIDGRIHASGEDGGDAMQTGSYSSIHGYRPYRDVSGGAGGPGGGDGGDNGYGTTYLPAPRSGDDGEAPAGVSTGGGGGGGPGTAFTYTTDSSTYHYYYFSGSGGGGGGVLPGGDGRVLMRYTSKRRAGVPGGGGDAVVDRAEPGESSLAGGAGGGAGSNGGYRNPSGRMYGYGDGAGGGGGGGAIRIESSGKLTLAGVLDVSGGNGGDATTNSTSRSCHPGAGGGGGGGTVVLLAKKGFAFGEHEIDASGGVGGKAHHDHETSSYDYGDNVYARGGAGGSGGILLGAGSAPAVLNAGNLRSGEGSVTTGRFFHTNTAVSTWLDAEAIAPEFLSAAWTGPARAELSVMGAQSDPSTGEVDEATATAWVPASRVRQVSGYRYFRFRVVLTGSRVEGRVPEVDRVQLAWRSRR